MPSILSGYLLFLPCLAVCAGQETGKALDLTTAHPVVVLLTPGHSATLRLELSGSEAEELFLDAAVPDISYRILASDGTQIRSASVGTFGWTAIPFAIPAFADGQHEIRVQMMTEGGAEGLPGVRVRAERHLVPSRELDVHERAAQAFNSAQILHRSMRSEDIRQAIAKFEQAAGEWARAGDQYGEALAMAGVGESEIELSQYARAKQTLHRALSLAGKNAYLSGWLLHLAARVLFDQYQASKPKGTLRKKCGWARRLEMLG
jgi:tetratricopeptide (TPR) repeat protein